MNLSSPMSDFLNWLWGCRHKRTTFPQGRGRYCVVSCLDCGRPMVYDWQSMKTLPSASLSLCLPVEAVKHARVLETSEIDVNERESTFQNTIQYGNWNLIRGGR